MDGPMGLADSLGDSVAVGLTDSLGLIDPLGLGLGDPLGLGLGDPLGLGLPDSLGLGDSFGLGSGALGELSTSPPSAATIAEAVACGTVDSRDGTRPAIAAARALTSAPAVWAAKNAARRPLASRIRTPDGEPCWRS